MHLNTNTDTYLFKTLVTCGSMHQNLIPEQKLSQAAGASTTPTITIQIDFLSASCICKPQPAAACMVAYTNLYLELTKKYISNSGSIISIKSTYFQRSVPEEHYVIFFEIPINSNQYTKDTDNVNPCTLKMVLLSLPLNIYTACQAIMVVTPHIF